MSGTSPRVVVAADTVTLSGEWTLAALLPEMAAVKEALKQFGVSGKHWNLETVSRLDSAAAALLWRAWGRQWPQGIALAPELRQVIERAATTAALPDPPPPADASWLEEIGRVVIRIGVQFLGAVALFGRLLLDVMTLLRKPQTIPLLEISANIYKAGARALPVLALVGFLIGVTISYLSALQLKMFGADLYIVNILGISIIRELGPVLVAVLVAGRSGSSMTAQIGVMRVTEEIDALAVMGISVTERVVLPKVVALTLVMPLLVLWSSGVALFGGMLAALVQLDLSLAYFIDNLPRAVPAANLIIGLSKGAVFGFAISLIACHFGLRVKPNTESLSANTTLSVVSSITLVILLDAVFAVMTRHIGMPGG